MFGRSWRLIFGSLKGEEAENKERRIWKEIQEEMQRSEEVTKEFYRIPYFFYVPF